jgi:peptide/bleomycin uptake transporter
MFNQFFCECGSSPSSTVVAWLGTLLIVGHAAVHGWVKYAVNAWYRDFYDLLEVAGALTANASATEADWTQRQAQVGSGLWAFGQIALVAVIVMPIAKLVRSAWALRWRLALMRAYALAWDPNRAPIEGASQRVHEDSYRFSKGVELCLSTVLDSVITLVVFIPILVELGTETACPQSLSAFEFMGTGWLVGLAIVSAVLGLAVTMALGHNLVRLEVENQVVEAKMRRDLVVLETTPASICAVYHVPDASASCDEVAVSADVDVDARMAMGDAIATSSFLPPFTHFIPIFNRIRQNYDRLFINFTILNLWLAIFDQFNIILPYMIFAPLLFAPDPKHRILLGTLVQVSNAFDKVFGSLSVVAENWAGINEFRSVLVRLRQFERNVFHNVPHPSRSDTHRQYAWPIFRSMYTTRVSCSRTHFGEPTIQLEDASARAVLEDCDSSTTSRV